MQSDRYCQSPPLSPGSRPAADRYSVAQLSLQLSQYSLRQREYVDYTTGEAYPTDISYDCPSDSSVPPTELSSPTSAFSLSPISTHASSTFPSTSSEASSSSLLSAGYYSTNIRQQRQQALRRQCSASHLREISDLVSRMVSEGDQCSVSTGYIGRSRQNSDPTSDASSVIRMHKCAADDNGDDSMEESLSEPETFNDPYEGFKIQEPSGCVGWNCPWTSRRRQSDVKCCIKKDTSARKRGKPRAH